ncbi:ABC transporter permease [Pseudoclavibacter sp. CFCC 13611]|uniref:ABC transporter permease n=1 Tax=Pseudoclavibacter sp. CFCC 13611 TaxID=2615178 RepID=UPI001CE40EB9|nr:ABC transporter permease subunit [Pseudoclavibacter sp. CFCC 13611]
MNRTSWSDRLTVWLALAFTLIPIGACFVAATSVNFAQGPWGAGITFEWLAQAVSQLGPMLTRSLALAAVIAVANLVFGYGLSGWIARSGSWLSKLVGQVVNLPLAVPGIALGIALVTLYPKLRASGLLLACGHLVFTLPFTLATLIPALRDPAVQEAEIVARTLGARTLTRARTVTLPAIRIALGQAAITAFALSFGEFNISFFVNPPASTFAPFALFDAYATQRLEVASAETILFLLCLLPVLLVVVLLTRRQSSSATITRKA